MWIYVIHSYMESIVILISSSNISVVLHQHWLKSSTLSLVIKRQDTSNNIPFWKEIHWSHKIEQKQGFLTSNWIDMYEIVSNSSGISARRWELNLSNKRNTISGYEKKLCLFQSFASSPTLHLFFRLYNKKRKHRKTEVLKI